MLPTNKNNKNWKTKTPKRPVVDENLAKHRVFVIATKKPSKHKRHTPRGGRRTCYLVVVVVVVVVGGGGGGGGGGGFTCFRACNDLECCSV